MRFSLQNRLAWSVGALIAFLVGITLVFGIQTSLKRAQFKKDFKSLLFHHRIITLSLKLLSDAKDLETGQRGFLLTGDSSYLEPYQNSRTSILAHLDMLLSASQKSPAILAQAEASGQLLAREISILNRAIVTQEVSGQKRALQIVTTGEPKRRMDNLRSSIGNILLTQNREIVLIEARTYKDRRNVKRNFLIFMGGSVSFIIIALFIILGEIRKNSRLMKRLENESSHDELTGIPNRRFLQEWIRIEILKDRNKEFPFLLLFLDLNHFKSINDRLGHDVGDMVLKNAVKRFQTALREGDLLARIGGDEFIAIIRGKISREEQNDLIMRLKKTLLQPSLLPKDFPVRFGLSVGVATYPEDGETLDALLLIADKGMYEDKQTSHDS